MNDRTDRGTEAPAGATPRRSGEDRARDRRQRRRLLAVVVAAVVAAGVGAVLFTVARHRRDEAMRARLAHAAELGPRVLVAAVEASSGERTVTLPGDVRAFEQATLYAKVNGYVAAMLVDKGDRVRKGQVLARIASPETDKQVQSARAALDVARRNEARAQKLAPRGIVSQAELDQAVAALRTAEGEYQRVGALQSYEILRAPFDGIVTARYVDPGALMTATATGQPVVDVASPNRVRILVYVGQDVAPFVRLGDPAEVTVDQVPGVGVAAHVRRMADALDPRSRTMLVEVWPDGQPAFHFVPGLFVHVALTFAAPPVPEVPSEALVARGEKLEVAVVRDRRLHFVEVQPGNDDGQTVQILSGVERGELVAISPPSDLGEGAPIQPVERRPKHARPPAARRTQGERGEPQPRSPVREAQGEPGARGNGANDPPR